MSKFKKGDRVVNLMATEYVPKGAKGTVLQNNCSAPDVFWDELTEYAMSIPVEVDEIESERYIWARNESYLQLIEHPFHTFLTQKNPLYADGEMHVNLTVNQLLELVGEWENKK